MKKHNFYEQRLVFNTPEHFNPDKINVVDLESQGGEEFEGPQDVMEYREQNEIAANQVNKKALDEIQKLQLTEYPEDEIDELNKAHQSIIDAFEARFESEDLNTKEELDALLKAYQADMNELLVHNEEQVQEFVKETLHPTEQEGRFAADYLIDNFNLSQQAKGGDELPQNVAMMYQFQEIDGEVVVKDTQGEIVNKDSVEQYLRHLLNWDEDQDDENGVLNLQGIDSEDIQAIAEKNEEMQNALAMLGETEQEKVKSDNLNWKDICEILFALMNGDFDRMDEVFDRPQLRKYAQKYEIDDRLSENSNTIVLKVKNGVEPGELDALGNLYGKNNKKLKQIAALAIDRKPDEIDEAAFNKSDGSNSIRVTLNNGEQASQNATANGDDEATAEADPQAQTSDDNESENTVTAPNDSGSVPADNSQQNESEVLATEGEPESTE